MIGRYLYLDIINDGVVCPTCGRRAVKARTETDKARIAYAVRGDKPWFISGDNPWPTNVTFYGDCECGAAVPFKEPDIGFFTEAYSPIAERFQPLFDDPEAARRFGEQRRDDPNTRPSR